jgi:hypothetical protein
VGAGTELSGIAKTLASIAPKIKIPVQLAAFVAAVLTFCVAAVLYKNAPFHAVAIAGLGALFIAYAQVFAQLDKLPEDSRASFLLRSLLLFILAFALTLVSAGFLIWNGTKKPSEIQSNYPPPEQRLVDLGNEMDKIRPIYMSLPEHLERALEVDRRARQLAERMLAVQDNLLRPGLRIYKYESVAYSWAMVLGSQSDNNAKSKTIDKILDAAEKGNGLVNEAMNPNLEDKKALDLQDWVIRDNALPRLKRMKAIALCARWQIDYNPEDRKEVRKLFAELPDDYRREEHPQDSDELRRCLTN